MQAHEDEKGPKRRQARRLGPREVFFFSFSVLLTMKAHSSPRRPTQANEGQCRPTKTKKGPNDARRVAWAPGKFFFFFLRFIDNESPQQRTTANAGPRRPTKANAGPRRRKRAQTTPGASLGPQVSFFFSFSVLLTTKAHSSPRRPTQATAGQRRPMQAHKDEKGPKRRQARRFGPWEGFFFVFSPVYSQRKPTAPDDR